jgi:hypothetical protein
VTDDFPEVNPFRLKVTDGPHRGLVIYQLQVREPDADAVDTLLDVGWIPLDPRNQAALKTTVIFVTTDEDVAFATAEPEHWANTPMFETPYFHSEPL